MQCMLDEDVTQLCKVPGIGKKTAQRLVVEMKDRLEKEFSEVALEASVSNQGSGVGERNDAIAALVALGYKNTEAARVVKSLPSDLRSEELIRQALRALSGNVL